MITGEAFFALVQEVTEDFCKQNKLSIIKISNYTVRLDGSLFIVDIVHDLEDVLIYVVDPASGMSSDVDSIFYYLLENHSVLWVRVNEEDTETDFIKKVLIKKIESLKFHFNFPLHGDFSWIAELNRKKQREISLVDKVFRLGSDNEIVKKYLKSDPSWKIDAKRFFNID